MSIASKSLNRSDIDSIARTAARRIESQHRKSEVQRAIPLAAWLSCPIPVGAILVQLVRWVSRQPAGVWYSLPAICIGAVVPPIVWLAYRWLAASSHISRKNALGTVDEAIRSRERVVTADAFLQSENQSGFMLAAVEDAESWIEQARNATLDLDSGAVSFGRSVKLAMVVTAILIAISYPLSQLERARAQATPAASVSSGKQTGVTRIANSSAPDSRPDEEPEQKRTARKQTKKRSTQKGQSAATSTPDLSTESRGQLTDGESSESQQSSSPSSAEGVPSTNGQPSKAGDPAEIKKKKSPKKSKSRKPREPKVKPAEEPSGASSGQGSSSGSNNNAAASDWSSRNQQATPDDEEPGDEDDVDDDDEEQESRGGMQPNLRDRRTPVNRDLNVGLGNGRPNPDANGRGGPGGHKKSRGVASLVLGVPIPDRINGQPNKGRTRITQQRITPKAEDAEQVAAQERGARNGSSGRIAHPKMEPWLRNLVRDYFLQRRSATTSP